MVSTRRMPWVNACTRRSGPASTSTCASAVSTKIDGRRRRSRGSADRHTGQSQPIIGTPCDVPVPRKVTFKSGFDDALVIAPRLHVAHAQVVQEAVEDLRLGGGEIAPGLLLQHAEHLEEHGGGLEVRFGALARGVG